MRAAVMRDSRIVLDTVPDPTPGPTEVLVKTLACGICGSDLHALHHADKMLESAQESGLSGPGAPAMMDPAHDVVMGHEFCAEVVEHGPNTTGKLAAGTRVVSVPILFRTTGIHAVGYSNDAPGGYGEAMLLSEPFLLEVPNGLPTEHAALTEPMAVGAHAVAKAGLAEGDAALVVGCGPVGLAVIASLVLRGVELIVASDFSPMRRKLAEGMGAHAVVDPAETTGAEALRKLAPVKPAVLFECVGVPGLIQQTMKEAPRGARIVVAGVCMEVDSFKPMIGINKELSLQFVLGYTPEEFAGTPAVDRRGRDRRGAADHRTGRPRRRSRCVRRPVAAGGARQDPGRAPVLGTPLVPELPEVEVTRRRIEPLLVGRTIESLRTTSQSYLFVTPPGVLRRRLRGRTTASLGRVGKYLVAELDDASRFVVHLGMTGQLFGAGANSVRLLKASARAALGPEEQAGFRPDEHTHLRLRFKDEGPRGPAARRPQVREGLLARARR